MKLVIFIPAFNEEASIGKVIDAILDFDFKEKLPIITEWQLFVIDDGSKDRTAEIARNKGVTVFTESNHQGLANAFKIGLRTAIKADADLIVHLDADGQYLPAEIPKILCPIIGGEADLASGDRQIAKLHFLGWSRKYGNLAGSWFLRFLTGIKVNDVSSGFRAYTKEAASKLEINSSHTYTHESLIQANYKGLRIAEVPITFLPRAGSGTTATKVKMAEILKPGIAGHEIVGTGFKNKSRLTDDLLKHILKSLLDIFRAKKKFSGR